MKGSGDFFFEIISQIPRGRVSTYGAVAKAIGKPLASRAVGRMLGANPYAPDVPCHRVVMSDGKLGGYTSAKGAFEKIRLLEAEGVRVLRGRVVDFENILFTDFKPRHSKTQPRVERQRGRARI